jgi:hypothetical protein
MNRFRQVVLVAAVFIVVAAAWPADASAAQRRRGRFYRPVRPVVYSYGFYRPFYSYYWSPWYGPWPGWYGPHGPYWDYPYYRRYYDPTGGVRVQVSPREAQVYVDGYFVGIADDFDGVFQRLRLRPGGHEIVLHLPGYRNTTQRLYVQQGSTVNLKHQMEPLPAGAPEEPLPKPDPEAAKAAERAGEYDEDEYERGRRPDMDRRRSPPAPRERDDRDDRVRESRFGSLAIRVQPADAIVIVDGSEWRGAADDEGEILIQVPPGRHRIELRKDRYETFTTEVDVQPGVSTPINVLLQSRE